MAQTSEMMKLMTLKQMMYQLSYTAMRIICEVACIILTLKD